MICSCVNCVVDGGVGLARRDAREFGSVEGSTGEGEEDEEARESFKGDATIESRKGCVVAASAVLVTGTVGGRTEGGGRMMNWLPDGRMKCCATDDARRGSLVRRKGARRACDRWNMSS